MNINLCRTRCLMKEVGLPVRNSSWGRALFSIQYKCSPWYNCSKECTFDLISRLKCAAALALRSMVYNYKVRKYARAHKFLLCRVCFLLMHAPKLLRVNKSSFHRTLRFVFFQIVEFFCRAASGDCHNKRRLYCLRRVLILRQRFVWIE